MENKKKTISLVRKIKISDIYSQNMIGNRTAIDVEHSIQYLALLQSIKQTGGIIHPITVRQDSDGKYELFSGYRRFLAYIRLNEMREEGYETIPATIWPSETSNTEMIKKTVHENKVRSNLSSIEKIEQEIAAVSVYFNCEVPNDIEQNKKKGYEILSLYLRYLRSERKEKYANDLMEVTGCTEPWDVIRDFFTAIGETERNFIDKAREIVLAPDSILSLLTKKRISIRNAKDIRNIKSDNDREMITQMLQNQELTNSEIGILIQESRRKHNPNKRIKEFIDQLKETVMFLGYLKEDLTEEKYERIKDHLRLAKVLLDEIDNL